MKRILLAIAALSAATLFSAPLSAAGPVDSGFGKGGAVLLDAEEHKEGAGVAGIVRTTSGDFRVFAQVNGDVGIFAFDSSGSLDRSFHDRGWMLSDPVQGHGADWDMPEALVRSGGQTIVAGGIDYVSAYASYQHQTISKFADDGSLVKSFGNGGTVRVRALRRALGLVVDSKGRLLTVSQKPKSGGRYSGKPLVPSSYAIARFTRAGQLDPSFGKGGIVRHTAPLGSQVTQIQVDQQDRPVVLSTDDVGTKKQRDERYTLLRYKANGSPDRAFGSGGESSRPLPHIDVDGLAVFPDGSSLVAGVHGRDNDLRLIRFAPDGSLNTGYGEAGVAVIDEGRGGGEVSSMTALDDDGRVAFQWGKSLRIATGEGVEVPLDLTGMANSGTGAILATADGSFYTAASADRQPVMGHLRPDLTVDQQFSLNGLPQEELVFHQGRGLYGLGLVSNDGIASAIDVGDDLYSGAPALYLTDRNGKLRTGFGTNGAADLDQSFSTVVGISEGRKGGIRVIGANRSKTVFQINVDKTGKAGKATLEDFKGNDYSDSIRTADGGLIAFGEAFSRSRPEDRRTGFRIARYNPDGSLNYKFGRYGITQVFFRLGAIPTAASFDGKGRLVLAGGFCSTQYRCVDDREVTQKVTFVRLKRDGSLDRTFGLNGRAQYKFGRSGAALDVVALESGRIVARTDAFCHDDCYNGLSLIGLRADGSLDRGFGKAGKISRKLGRTFEGVKLFRAGRNGVDLAASVETCGSRPSYGVLRLGRGGKPDRKFGGGDGLLAGLPKGMLGGFPYYAVRQNPGTITFGGQFDTKGTYGGAESATGLTRLKLKSSDGKSSLKPCAV